MTRTDAARGASGTEADRWLGAPLLPLQVVVHGVAGGVGTSTVAGLLRAVLAVRATGRDGPAGGEGVRLTVEDRGSATLLPGAGDRAVVPVVACPATVAGLTAAADLLGGPPDVAPSPRRAPEAPTAREAAAGTAAHRAVVVAVPVSGPGLDGRALLEAVRGAGVADGVVALPRSRALAAGAGPAAIAVDPLLAGRLAAVGAAVVRCARWRAAVPHREA